MVHSQLFLLVLLYANMLFCILVTPKSTGYRYWWITAKSFSKNWRKEKSDGVLSLFLKQDSFISV